MDYPLTQKQFAARLIEADFQLINDLIPELFPDRDLSDKSLTGREIVIALAETAAMKLTKIKASRPEDLDRIKELENQLSTEQDENEKLTKRLETYQSKIDELVPTVSKLETLNSELTARNTELETELSGISTEKTEVTEKVRTLEKYIPFKNEMRIIVEPLTLALLALYAEKVQRKTGRTVSTGEILTTLFTRYVTKRETELPGFPFLVSKQEIIELVKSLENE